MGRAMTRSKSPEATGEDLDARLAAIAGSMERILAHPSELCEEAALEMVNLSEQLAALRVAREDALVDAFAISTAYAAGLAEGERRATERQQVPGPRKGGGTHGKQRPLMRAIKGGLAAVGLGAAFHAVGRAAAAHPVLAAATVASGVALTAVVSPASHLLPNISPSAVPPAATATSPAYAAPVPSSRLIATVTKAPKRKHPASVSTSSSLLLPPSSAAASSPASQSSSPPSQGPVQGKPSWGTLTLPVTSVSITDPTLAATVTLNAGTDGDVPWGLRCRAPEGTAAGCADITFSATSGNIPAGTSQDVTLTFDQAAQQAGGSVTLTFGQGQEVTVIWLPLVPVTVPVPVPVVTGVVPAVTGVVPAVTAIPSVAVTLP